MDLKQNRVIEYGTDVTDFPNPKVGDRIYITADGTINTSIIEKWEWRGNHWIDVVDLQGGGGSTGILGQDFEVNINPSKSFGKYKNGDTIPATGKTIEQFFDDVLTETIPPNYVNPTATIVATTSKYEVGEVVDISLSSTFNQNDAGSFTSVQIQRNGVSISTSEIHLDENVTIPPQSSPLSYRARYDYLQGPVKNNNLGDPDPTGQIPAGHIFSNVISVFGLKKFFWGNTDAFIGNDSVINPSLIHVRAIGQSQFEDENSREFIINTGDEYNSFWFWVPNDYELQDVIDLDALNLNLNSEYQEYSKTINNGGGGTIAGKIYIMRQDIPYSINHRHKVKIKLI